MKYLVDVNGETVEVELTPDGIRVDGEPTNAHLAQVDGTPIHLITLGGTLHRIAVRAGSTRGRYQLWTDGRRFDVEALDERTRAIREATAASSTNRGPSPLIAPMPGLVVRVDVKVGDPVVPGQALVVMEAMKMENELRASATGTVSAIHAVVGQPVEKGTVLVELS